MSMKIFIVIAILYSASVFCQDKNTAPETGPQDSPAWTEKDSSEIYSVFGTIEQGLRTGNTEIFRKYFSSIVSVSLGTAERRYFSENQAALVISGYMADKKTVTFEFSRIHIKASIPYATGRLTYNRRGIQSTLQIYVSLGLQDSRWGINQFNIY
jgi:hypothetical protein